MGSCLSSDSPSSPRSPADPRRGTRKGKGTGDALSSDEQQALLHRVPGRIFLSGSSTSGMASLFTQQGKKGTNQDAMVVWENFGPFSDSVFCGVFDGHGPYGHMVARRVRDYLPLKLSSDWEVKIASNHLNGENHCRMTSSTNPVETASLGVGKECRASGNREEERLPEIFTTLKESFLKAFKVMDKELELHPNIDCFCSGTTAVTLVKQDQDLVIGNVGDSRAVLATRDENDCLIAVQLTVDLKPNLPKEEERIKRCKGRIFSLRDEPEVARVWLPHNDSPGLAMARAFGDFCLKDFGLISVPEIFYRRLTERDEFIVMATDGVWDVLSNKEVVDIVASAPSRSSAARTLVQSAVRAWRFKYPTSKTDDCAVVCLFLAHSEALGSAAAAVASAGSNTNKQGEQSGSQQPSMILTDRAVSEFESHPCPSDGNSTVGDDWSALEGVARVNTLLTLPRFNVTGEKKRSAGIKAKK